MFTSSGSDTFKSHEAAPSMSDLVEVQEGEDGKHLVFVVEAKITKKETYRLLLASRGDQARQQLDTIHSVRMHSLFMFRR